MSWRQPPSSPGVLAPGSRWPSSLWPGWPLYGRGLRKGAGVGSAAVRQSGSKPDRSEESRPGRAGGAGPRVLGVRRRVVTGPKPEGGAGDRGGTWAWDYGLGRGLGAGLELLRPRVGAACACGRGHRPNLGAEPGPGRAGLRNGACAYGRGRRPNLGAGSSQWRWGG